MNQTQHECKCGKNGGWLEIKDKDYNIDCRFCKREYTVKRNGEVTETPKSLWLHLFDKK